MPAIRILSRLNANSPFEEIHIAPTKAEVAKYFLDNHPQVRGWKRRSVSSLALNNIGDSVEKVNYRVELVSGDRRRKTPPELRDANSIIQNFLAIEDEKHRLN
jgi:hypothetical protein